jgi:probable HAF family extracellular repeat protein
MGINDRGDITGNVYTPIGRRAVIWPFGGTGALLPLLPGTVTSEAYAINARGDIVGYTADTGGAARAAFWPAGGTVVDIGTLPGGAYSQAFGVNDIGEVVGTFSAGHDQRAFIWNRRAGLQDLNTLIAPSTFVLTKAVGINSQGVIAALGYDPADAPAGVHLEAHEMPVRVFLLTR